MLDPLPWWPRLWWQWLAVEPYAPEVIVEPPVVPVAPPVVGYAPPVPVVPEAEFDYGPPPGPAIEVGGY